MINQNPRSHPYGLLPLVSTRFQILFHSLAQGSFHLSLTVLSSIGRRKYLALRDMVHADSRQIPRAWRYSGASSRSICFMFYRTITFFGLAFQLCSSYSLVIYTLWLLVSCYPLYPIMATCQLTPLWFRLFPVRSPLLRKSFLLSFPPVT